MKKYFVIASVVLFAACNDDASTTTTTTSDDSSMMSTTPATAPVDTAKAVASAPSAFESRSFLDIETGKSITVKRDTISNKYVNAATNREVSYYYDPITKDTFDSRGYILNNSLILRTANTK